MWFRQLEIRDLRNIEFASIELCSGLNYFYGDNGAGKTAILEAVHLLARGRSFRSVRVEDLVRRGQEALTVRAVAVDEHRGEQSIGLSRARSGRAELRINGETGRKLSQAAELLPLQTLGPSLSELVFGAPGVRRQWLDWGVFHVEHGYLAVLRDYLLAVRQRNAALRSLKAGAAAASEVDVWTGEVGRLGEQVTNSRRAYLADLAPHLQASLAALAPELAIELRYRPGWAEEESLRKVLGQTVSREVKSGLTLSGPHRADIDMRVGDMQAVNVLSRGQGKALASALMLAQAALLQTVARRASVFLIDDIGAELDLAHNARFFGLLGNLDAQVLATSNSGPETLGDIGRSNPRTFHVERGRVSIGRNGVPARTRAPSNEDGE